MSNKTPKTRRMRIPQLGSVKATLGWSNAALTMTFYDSRKGNREVEVGINNPWEAQELRRQLDKITQYWEARVREIRQ